MRTSNNCLLARCDSFEKDCKYLSSSLWNFKCCFQHILIFMLFVQLDKKKLPSSWRKSSWILKCLQNSINCSQKVPAKFVCYFFCLNFLKTCWRFFHKILGRNKGFFSKFRSIFGTHEFELMTYIALVGCWGKYEPDRHAERASRCEKANI